MPLPLQFDDIHRVDFEDLSGSSRSRKSVDTGSLAEKVRTSGRQACGDEGQLRGVQMMRLSQDGTAAHSQSRSRCLGRRWKFKKVERGEPGSEWGLVVLCSAVEVLIADVRSLLIRPPLAS
jgi:hypothetical protein